ncbi:MAG: DUF3656 domain-containing protein, partial [Polyangiaceae bacterium]|nr:DUF3656 domain-containing protein [Polyangiaceae bacterium]
RVRGRSHIRARLSANIARGDGVLVEGGKGGAGEVGGRVWGIARVRLRGEPEDVERAAAGEEVLLWLGPERSVDEAAAGRRIFKTSDPTREKAVLSAIEADPRKLPISIRAEGRFGELPVFSARGGSGLTAEVTGDMPVDRARSASAIEDVLQEKLGRLGDTPFLLAEISVNLPEGALIPASSLNRARRALVEKLLQAARRAYEVSAISSADVLAGAQPPDREPPQGGLFVLCRSKAQAEAALDAGADGIYLDFLELTGTGAALRELRARGASWIGVAPPRIRKPGEEKIDKYLESIGPDAILVRGLGALREGSIASTNTSVNDINTTDLQNTNSNIPRVGDFSLNITNRLSAAEVLGRGLMAFTPSFDLDAAQLSALVDSPFGPWAEMVMHHPMPLFHMEHCVIAALLSNGKDFRDCGRPCDRHRVSLRDRAGMDHPVEADVGCRNTVFHAAAQSSAGIVLAAQRSGVRRFRIELVRESDHEVRQIVAAYRKLLQGSISPADLRRSLKTENGYGVVSGSLRVVTG